MLLAVFVIQFSKRIVRLDNCLFKIQFHLLPAFILLQNHLGVSKVAGHNLSVTSESICIMFIRVLTRHLRHHLSNPRDPVAHEAFSFGLV